MDRREKGDDLLRLRAPDGRQHATLSVTLFGADPSFDEFEGLCQLRLDAEKRDSPNCVIKSSPALDFKGTFGMYYFGDDKKTGRAFSAYLSLEKRELLALHVEGLGVDLKEHLETVQIFAQGFTRK